MGEQLSYTALVLAASRGNLDPLAQAGGVSHKCFIDIAGRPMLQRVVEGVMASPRVKHTIVAIEPDSMAEARQILSSLPGADAIEYVPSQDNIGTSVAAVAKAELLPPPVLAAIREALADLPQLPRINALTAPLAGSFASQAA